MALNPDDQNPPVDGGSGSGGTSGGSGSGTSGGSGSGTVTGWIQSLVKNATPVVTLTIDPSNPLDASGTTRYNDKTGKIESYNPISGKWNEVTNLVSSDKSIDLSQYTAKEIFDYMQSGLPIPTVAPVKKQIVTASTDTTTTKSKWWVWVLVAVAVGGGLFAVWKLAKKRSQRIL